MPVKKKKLVSTGRSQMFVLLHEQKKRRHFVAKREDLAFSEKDNLAPGTHAIFNGPGEHSSPCKCLVVLTGTKEHCETSLSLITKMNSNFAGENDSESDSSVDPEMKNFDDNEKAAENSDEESEAEIQRTAMPMWKKSRDVISKADAVPSASKPMATTVASTKNSTTKTVPFSVASRKEVITSTPPPTTNLSAEHTTRTMLQSSIDVLNDISNTAEENRKRKEPEEQSATSNTIKKRPVSVSHAMYERMRRENDQLKKQIQMYRENWMCRPSGPAALYLIEVGKTLSGQSAKTEEDEEEKLDEILVTLKTTEADLKSCEHETDITKTCRAIIKRIYPNPTDRAAMLISSMDSKQLKAVQTYARIAHPALAKVPNSLLNNAIGNVYASDKRNLERKNSGKRNVGETMNEDDDEEESEGR